MTRIISVATIALIVLLGVANIFAANGRRTTTYKSVFRSFAQENGWTALRTDDGILFIWNRRDLSFTLSIKGNEIRSMDSGENIFFMVDGRVLQIQSLPIGDFAPDARKKKLTDEAILAAHRDWESAFMEKELLHKKISVRSSTQKLANGTPAMVWQYDVPEGFRNPDAEKQMYVTVLAKDYLILLNGVVDSNFTEAAVRSFLLENIATLKISSELIDVKKVQEKIRKGQP